MGGGTRLCQGDASDCIVRPGMLAGDEEMARREPNVGAGGACVCCKAVLYPLSVCAPDSPLVVRSSPVLLVLLALNPEPIPLRMLSVARVDECMTRGSPSLVDQL